ncbi:MAG TPA: universal stress protein [Streptosporangiaceae bacterium]
MAVHSELPPGAFATLDESRITRFQWKIMFISGLGFFTDAYDLFVIGIVVALLKPAWGLLAEGDPTAALVRASAGADLLVLGIRGRSPVAGLRLGSVSQACAASASCPVVLVKRPDDAPQPPPRGRPPAAPAAAGRPRPR